MARAKTSEPSRVRSKAATAAAIEELTRGAGELKEFLSQVEDLGREGFPYLDAAKARTELQFRECIRRTFGEKSPEFQAHRQHSLFMGGSEETRQSIALIKSLIATLDQKKLELQGGPPLQQIPAAQPASSMPATPHLTLVPASNPAVQMAMTQTGPITPPPVAMATNPGVAAPIAVPGPAPLPLAEQIFSDPWQMPESLRPSTAPPAAVSTPAAAPAPAMPLMPAQPVVRVAPVPQPAPSPAAQTAPADPSVAGTVQQPLRGAATPIAHLIPAASPQPQIQDAPPVPALLQSRPAAPAGSFLDQKPAPQSSQAGSDPVERVKTLCYRFHSVARQLRLRGEYRATLSVEDEFDAQDLLHALLRIQFDNIETDEWTPSYSSGTPRTTLLLNDGRLAVIVKKTRPGLNAKDLTDQLRIDAERYRSYGCCRTLLCFMYDPEGRIGNPRGLEANLTSVTDSFVIDVLVAPK
jgi:REase_DpnII-MboI